MQIYRLLFCEWAKRGPIKRIPCFVVTQMLYNYGVIFVCTALICSIVVIKKEPSGSFFITPTRFSLLKYDLMLYLYYQYFNYLFCSLKNELVAKDKTLNIILGEYVLKVIKYVSNVLQILQQCFICF